jgi:hypothetical protein
MFAEPGPSGTIEVLALDNDAGRARIATVRPLASDLVVGQSGRFHPNDVRDADMARRACRDATPPSNPGVGSGLDSAS